MLKPISTLLIFCVVGSVVSAAPAEELLSFVKRNSGRFASEIDKTRNTYILRFKPIAGWWESAKYDQATESLVSEYLQSINSEWIFERCLPSGSFIGKNSLGATMTVQRQRCERLEVHESDLFGFPLNETDCRTPDLADRDSCRQSIQQKIQIPMTLDSYRNLKRLGPIYEMEFVLGEGVSQEVGQYHRLIDSATIQSPVERILNIYYARGRIRSLKIMAPGSGKILATYPKEK